MFLFFELILSVANNYKKNNNKRRLICLIEPGNGLHMVPKTHTGSLFFYYLFVKPLELFCFHYFTFIDIRYKIYIWACGERKNNIRNIEKICSASSQFLFFCPWSPNRINRIKRKSKGAAWVRVSRKHLLIPRLITNYSNKIKYKAHIYSFLKTN